MAGRGWWWQNYGFLWVVADGDVKIMAGRGLSWMVARFSNAPLKAIKKIYVSIIPVLS